MKIFYFTATGNSLFAAKQFNCEIISIPQVMKTSNRSFKDDMIGMIFPCFYLGIPRLVKEFIASVSLESPYFFGIVTYGTTPGSSLRILKNTAAKYDIHFSYLNQISMLDNYVPLYDMKKEKEILDMGKIQQNIELIIEDVKAQKLKTKPFNPIYSIITAYWQKKYKVRLKDAHTRFTIEKSCNQCGLCAKVCPINNIKLAPNPIYSDNCIECCACIHHCPQTAIHTIEEVNNERFICDGVKVSEIITANQ